MANTDNLLNLGDYYAQPGEMPDLGKVITITDYEEKLNDCKKRSTKIIEDMARLLLEKAEFLSHPYIQAKMEKDAENLSRIDFLTSSSEQVLIRVKGAIDSAPPESYKLYDSMAMLQKELRENLKFYTLHLNTMENFYRNIKRDLETSPEVIAAQQAAAAAEGLNPASTAGDESFKTRGTKMLNKIIQEQSQEFEAQRKKDYPAEEDDSFTL